MSTYLGESFVWVTRPHSWSVEKYSVKWHAYKVGIPRFTLAN